MGGRGRRIAVGVWPQAKKCENLSGKKTKTKRTEGLAQVVGQVVEHLLSKHKALNIKP
jgi:hypothetical protein